MGTEADRLHLLYEVNRRLATFTNLDELVRFATRRARELFEAQGCALLLHDAARGEFSFPVASQSESLQGTAATLSDVRFPAKRGIAGWVLERGEAAYVADAPHDPRFFDGVDRATAMHTRDVLCAPLRTREGTIGVIEVINPARVTDPAEDLAFLEALANDVAVAHEKAVLYERLRGEVLGLRQVCTLGGLGLLVLGILFLGGAVLGHLAWALPWSELPRRPGAVAGIVCLVVGGALLPVGRGWLVDRAHEALG